MIRIILLSLVMKKILFVSLLSIIAIRSFGFGDYSTVTLKVGESYSLTAANFNTSQTHLISGDAIIVSYISSSPSSYKIYAVRPGTASFSYYDKCVLFNVADVIPNNVVLLVGQNYTFSPNIGAGVKLTWSSSNTSIATVTSSGVVTGLKQGQVSITCKDANGTPFSCLVSIGIQLASSVTLNYHTYNLTIGDSFKLQTTILPSNVTSSNVKWLSSNENIAQVDDSGNVTAIAPGYCSIFAIADDGSAKFDHCLITVPGTRSRGDVNNDGDVDVNDVTSIVKIIQSIKQ